MMISDVDDQTFDAMIGIPRDCMAALHAIVSMSEALCVLLRDSPEDLERALGPLEESRLQLRKSMEIASGHIEARISELEDFP